MERIQEALKKARRERQFSKTTNRNDVTGLADYQTRGICISDRSVETDTGNLEYKNTRHVYLDEKELKLRKLFGGMAHHPLSDPYRQLRGQLLQKMRTNNWQTLAITSPSPNSGKTLTAVNLAISFALEANQTVLLADFNFRNPSIATTLGIDDLEYGITDYFDGTAKIEDILINPRYKGLVVLPQVQPTNFSSEILSSPKMKSLNEELRNRYANRIILYDLPPLLVHDDALTFIQQADATLLVIEDGGTAKNELERSIKLLNKTPIAGTVINKVR